MKKKFDLKSFVCGVLVMALILTLATPVWAAYTNKTINGLTGINVYINDQPFTPKDPNGKVVEPFVADGTTYLPMRAIAEALGVPVQWEGKTQSAYVGKHTSSTPAVYLADMEYFSSSGTVSTQAADQDNFGNSHIKVFQPVGSLASWNRSFQLNGRYSKLTGTLFQRYEDRSREIEKGTSIEIYGDGKLLLVKNFTESTSGYHPETFSLDMTGVLDLQINYVGSLYAGCNFSLGDAALWT